MRAPSTFASVVAASVFVCACGGAAPPVAPPPTATSAPAVAPEDAECAVWAREVSFAKSVADHDGKAFHEHLHPKAVFVDGDDSFLRGREAVEVSWRGIVEGQKVRLVWHPSAVVLTGDGSIALSRGPYVFEDLRPDAKQRFRKGTFQSIWARDTDGVWRVTVDGGTAPPVPATDEEAQKLLATMRVQCPRK